jgi:SAM-dependent methyltransferase
MEQLEKHFTDIYHSNAWHGQQSKSGTGSDLENTKIMRPQLVELINNLGIKTMIDAPCGDFNWMKEIINDLKIDKYVGADIVEEMVLKNKEKYENNGRVTFVKANVVEEILPKYDLIFSRDCLVHFSYETAKRIIRNFVASGSTYLLMTTFLRTDRKYFDILDGQWRAINFQLPPLSLPAPEKFFIEGCVEDHCRWTDKTLGLWKLCDLAECA